MCGICVIVLKKDGCEVSGETILPTETEVKLKHRGPDYLGSETVHYGNTCLNFNASVLCLRSERTSQPYIDDFGNILLWNGEIFGGNLYSDDEISDTILLSNALSKCSDCQDILGIIAGIKGPYAFVYFSKKDGCLWFGRDILGRRSLLCSCTDGRFVLSSVASGKEAFNELPCRGIYCLNLCQNKENNNFAVNLYPWTNTLSGLPVNHSSPDSFDSSFLKITASDTKVQSPITMPLNRTIPHNDLLLDVPNEELFEVLIRNEAYAQAVADFKMFLSEAVKLRVGNQMSLCKDCVGDLVAPSCTHSSISILFSGGLDSMVVATLADRYIPNTVPIDLLNVAFECVEKVNCNKNKPIVKSRHFNTPDRITGLKGLQELKMLNPERQWNFVEIDVTQSELEKERVDFISDLIFPSCTVLDDSIGCALWFAARGKGIVTDDMGEKMQYCSPSRVVLVGMGADELLGGYSRHRGKFQSGGWQSVIDEMALEIDRISNRNLCRDDRIISDHGREVRHPFLDEDVISFLNNLPIHIKTNLRYCRGFGEKLLLRLLAFDLGLKNAASLPKRAIQFGSRIARCENTREKGSDICQRLTKTT